MIILRVAHLSHATSQENSWIQRINTKQETKCAFGSLSKKAPLASMAGKIKQMCVYFFLSLTT